MTIDSLKTATQRASSARAFPANTGGVLDLLVCASAFIRAYGPGTAKSF